jgi:hypothetical protein
MKLTPLGLKILQTYNIDESLNHDWNIASCLGEKLYKIQQEIKLLKEKEFLSVVPVISNNGYCILGLMPNGEEALEFPEKYLEQSSNNSNIKELFLGDGKKFDAFLFISQRAKEANICICIIDNYADEMVLKLVADKKQNVEIKIINKVDSKGKNLMNFAVAQQFNIDYGDLKVRESSNFHDRFLIIDSIDFYHLGPSIKDAGKKVAMFSKIQEASIMIEIKRLWDAEWQNGKIFI